MKVYISADIEGITGVVNWDSTEVGKPGYEKAAAQMTAEVNAACQGAIAAGADYILVRDAHDSAANIDIAQLPRCTEVIRGWSGHPYSMVEGIDQTFDAAMFIGYHSPAGSPGNPLSHTCCINTVSVKLNGAPCSEFMLYSLACAGEGVPTVLLTGDQMLCDQGQGLHPQLETVAVKTGFGGMVRSINPSVACEKIQQGAESVLRRDLREALCAIPKNFLLEIHYKEQHMAARNAFYPGFTRIDGNRISMETDEFFEILRACEFVLC